MRSGVQIEEEAIDAAARGEPQAETIGDENTRIPLPSKRNPKRQACAGGEVKMGRSITFVEGRSDLDHELVTGLVEADQLNDVLARAQPPCLFLQVQAQLLENQVRPWQ